MPVDLITVCLAGLRVMLVERAWKAIPEVTSRRGVVEERVEQGAEMGTTMPVVRKGYKSPVPLR